MIAEKTYLITLDGRLMPHGHPDGVTQIARAGCHVDDDVAEEYGLPREYDAEPIQTPHAEPAPETPPAAMTAIGEALSCAMEDAAEAVDAVLEHLPGRKAQRPGRNKALGPSEDK